MGGRQHGQLALRCLGGCSLCSQTRAFHVTQARAQHPPRSFPLPAFAYDSPHPFLLPFPKETATPPASGVSRECTPSSAHRHRRATELNTQCDPEIVSVCQHHHPRRQAAPCRVVRMCTCLRMHTHRNTSTRAHLYTHTQKAEHKRVVNSYL